MASDAAVKVSQDNRLTAARARWYQRELRSLPVMRSFGEMCGEGERCSSLESLTLLANKENPGVYFEIDTGLDQMFSVIDRRGMTGESERKRRQAAFKKLVASGDVDWSEVFRQYNVFWDKLKSACNYSPRSKAVAMLESLESEARMQAKTTIDVVLSEEPPVRDMNAKLKAQHIARLAVLPGPLHQWQMYVPIEQKHQARENMTLLAFALAGYRANHGGEYPKTLAELAPVYIDTIPKDPFTDGDLHYKSDGKGYLLYSVGQNRKDDGGFGQGNMPDSTTEAERKAWDDISIRTPRKKTEPKP
jgi:hypothetical protein